VYTLGENLREAKPLNLPQQEKPMGVLLSSYLDRAAFAKDRFNPVVLSGNERVRIVLVCCEAGQFIPVHQPGVDLTFVILEGEGRLVAGAQEEHVRAGAIAFIPAGEARGLKAETRLVALHVVTPPPTAADHAGVADMLKRGVWK
jgi:quercetin dioxygenase-like cupin family protein